jgi:hypothetical protein
MAEYPKWKRETVDLIEDARPIVDRPGLNTPKLHCSPPAIALPVVAQFRHCDTILRASFRSVYGYF